MMKEEKIIIYENLLFHLEKLEDTLINTSLFIQHNCQYLGKGLNDINYVLILSTEFFYQNKDSLNEISEELVKVESLWEEFLEILQEHNNGNLETNLQLKLGEKFTEFTMHTKETTAKVVALLKKE